MGLKTKGVFLHIQIQLIDFNDRDAVCLLRGGN